MVAKHRPYQPHERHALVVVRGTAHPHGDRRHGVQRDVGRYALAVGQRNTCCIRCVGRAGIERERESRVEALHVLRSCWGSDVPPCGGKNIERRSRIPWASRYGDEVRSAQQRRKLVETLIVGLHVFLLGCAELALRYRPRLRASPVRPAPAH